jgi:hypothetical protein
MDKGGYALAFLPGNMAVNVAWFHVDAGKRTKSPWQGLGDVYGVENRDRAVLCHLLGAQSESHRPPF